MHPSILYIFVLQGYITQYYTFCTSGMHPSILTFLYCKDAYLNTLTTVLERCIHHNTTLVLKGCISPIAYPGGRGICCAGNVGPTGMG
jgi:hypothetical protein